MDVQGFLERYTSLKDTTRYSYRNTLDRLERFVANDEPTDDEVRAFLHQFKKGSTLQRHKAAIRCYFEYKDRAWLFKRREFIKAIRRLPHYLTWDQVKRLIECAEDEHERMFVKTLFETGVRISELMSLTKESIEPAGVRVMGKGDKERVVPIIDKGFQAELEAYAAKREDKLFPDSYYNYWFTLRKLCLRAGVPIVSPHTLRHSAAVDLINRGLPLGGVKEMLGHEKEETTLIYTKLTQTDLRHALGKMEARENV